MHAFSTLPSIPPPSPPPCEITRAPNCHAIRYTVSSCRCVVCGSGTATSLVQLPMYSVPREPCAIFSLTYVRPPKPILASRTILGTANLHRNPLPGGQPRVAAIGEPWSSTAFHLNLLLVDCREGDAQHNYHTAIPSRPTKHGRKPRAARGAIGNCPLGPCHLASAAVLSALSLVWVSVHRCNR